MSTSYKEVAASEKDDDKKGNTEQGAQQVADVEAQGVQIELKKDEKVHNEYKTTPNDLDPGLDPATTRSVSSASTAPSSRRPTRSRPARPRS